MYKLEMNIVETKCLQVITQTESSKWCARLGHIGENSIKTMNKDQLVLGLSSLNIERETCASCSLGKQTRRPFPTSTTYRATEALELIHGVLCGPITPPTAGRNRYIFVLIDDYSRYMWSILLREKGETFDKFKIFKAIVEGETKKTIKTLRMDRGGEFTSNEFRAFCEKSGINRHLTSPYSPQQNGVVERRNRTLLEMTRSILKHMSVPNYLWEEGVRHSTYLINRVATRVLKSQTPYEALKGQKPNVEHLRVFGCIGYAKTNSPYLRKLDDRTRTLVHLGTEPGSKAYRLFDPMNRRLVVSRDVVFDENKGWTWSNTTRDSLNEPGTFKLSFRDHGDNALREDEGIESDHEAEEEDNDRPEMINGTPINEGTEQSEDNVRRSTRIRKAPGYL